MYLYTLWLQSWDSFGVYCLPFRFNICWTFHLCQYIHHIASYMAKPLLQILPNLTILNIQIYNIILKPSGIEGSKEMVQYILKVVICIDTTILMFMLMQVMDCLPWQSIGAYMAPKIVVRPLKMNVIKAWSQLKVHFI